MCCVAVSAAAGSAHASGFSTARFGGEHGYPVTFNPTAVYYNPAAIAESEGYHVFVDGSIAFRTASYDHSRAPSDTVEPAGAAGANTGKATLFNIAAAPMIGATGKFGDFALGLAWYVPFGGSSEWSKDDDWLDQKTFAGPYDGEQRWYSISGTLRAMYWTLDAAYKIPKTGLSLGVSGSLIRAEVKTIRARNANGSDEVLGEGRSLIDVGDWAWGFGVGATYEFIPKKLFAGLSYTSRPNVAGGMALDGVLVNNFGGSRAETPIDFHQDLPDIVRLGARWKVRDNVELRLHGDWSRWSSMENQCLVPDNADDCPVEANGAATPNTPGDQQPLQNLPRDWQDAFGVRAGGSFFVSPMLEVFAGLGYDSNAIPDESLDPALTDFHDISAALGGRVTIGKHLGVAASWTQFFYFSRDTNGKSINANYQPPSTGPDAGGKYTQRIGVLNINVEAMF